jgi:hypothetical protein
MRSLRWIIILLIGVFTASSSAQQLPSRDSKALAILSQSYAAMGGVGWAVVRSTQATAEVTTWENGGPTATTVNIITRGGTDLHMESPDSIGTVLVINSSRAWTLAPGERPAHISRLSLGNTGITHIPALSVLSRWADPRVIVSYVGLESVGGAAVHHITLQAPLDPALGLGDHDLACHIYIDSQSLLVTRLDYPIRAPSNLLISQLKTATYDDYKLVAGLLVSFKTTYSISGHVLSSQVLTKISFNVPTTDSTFGVVGVQ